MISLMCILGLHVVKEVARAYSHFIDAIELAHQSLRKGSQRFEIMCWFPASCSATQESQSS